MRSFSARFTGALRLDVDVYEEVEADRTATAQAAGVVVLSSAASGVGVGIGGGVQGLILGTVAALIGWFLWAVITHFIGTRILPTPRTSTNWGELLRTTGFAAAPGVFRIFAVVPLLGVLIWFLAGVWMLVAFVIAVRQALDYESTWRAVAVCITGWLFYVLVGVLLIPFAR